MLLTGCGHPPARTDAGILRLGYVSELAQAAPLSGVREGLYARALGPGVQLRLATFDSDTAAAAALSAGTIDAAYLDPNSAYDVFAGFQHRPGAMVVTGAASGGAMLVTRDSITAASDLRGRTIAVPRHGSAQDIALRTWLASVGVAADGPGAVSIVETSGPDTLAAFRSGSIDGAWLPEPWATRLVTDGAGRILVDERALWPGGAFASAVLTVRRDYASAHPSLLRGLLRGHLTAEDLVTANPAAAQHDVILEITAISGQDVATAVPAAWPRMRFTNDPMVTALQEAADHARQPGVPRTPDLRGFVNVGPLNAILRTENKATVGQ